MSTLHDYTNFNDSKGNLLNSTIVSCFNNCVKPNQNTIYKFEKNLNNEQNDCLKNCFTDKAKIYKEL